MQLRKYERREWSEALKARSVTAPVRHAGVGDALRSAYHPRTHDLPMNMIELLAKLS